LGAGLAAVDPVEFLLHFRDVFDEIGGRGGGGGVATAVAAMTTAGVI